MSDIVDRLAALDPAAHDPYQARNVDQMISRIVATSPSGAARSAWWQQVQLRIAGTLILGTLIGAGTVAIVAGGPSLATLAIQTKVADHPGVFATENAAQPFEATKFAPAGSLASSSPSGTSMSSSFQLSIPKDSAGEAAHLASVFHVMGSVRHSGHDWTVTSSSGASFDYQTSGASPQWYFSSTTPTIAPSTASNSVDVVMPSHATVANDVRSYLQRLGFTYVVSDPVFSESTLSSIGVNGAPQSQSLEEVSYTVTVRGVDTDQTVSFSVNPRNVAVYAQGPAFDVSSDTNYPLVSALDGVNELNALEKTESPSPTLGASTAAPVALHATLTAASISLAAFQLENGTRWLLPLYTYSGHVAHGNGETTNRTWSEIAIEPSYVQLSASEARSILNH
jgi:hypothetical protein